MPRGLDERMAVLGPHLFDGVPLTQAAERAGVPLRSAYRWLASYRVSGSAGLPGKPVQTMARTECPRSFE